MDVKVLHRCFGFHSVFISVSIGFELIFAAFRFRPEKFCFVFTNIIPDSYYLNKQATNEAVTY